MVLLDVTDSRNMPLWPLADCSAGSAAPHSMVAPTRTTAVALAGRKPTAPAPGSESAKRPCPRPSPALRLRRHGKPERRRRGPLAPAPAAPGQRTGQHLNASPRSNFRPLTPLRRSPNRLDADDRGIVPVTRQSHHCNVWTPARRVFPACISHWGQAVGTRPIGERGRCDGNGRVDRDKA